MDDSTPDNDGFHGLTAHQAMAKCRAVLKRLGELTVEEIDRDLARVASVSQFEQLVLKAKWMKELDLWSLVRRSMQRYETPVGRFELATDLVGRLDWYKKRVAADYEKRVKADVEAHQATSSVGQVFLMEWNYSRADEKCGATIRPQKQMTRDGREFRIDFMIEATDGAKRLAVELDGLDFLEEAQQQAARARQLERSAGHDCPVFRFTGAEIVRDTSRCVEEIVEFFESSKRDVAAVAGSREEDGPNGFERKPCDGNP